MCCSDCPGDGDVVLFEAHWALFLSLFWWLYACYFSLLGTSSLIFTTVRCSLSFEAPFECYQISEAFSCSPFPVEFTAPSFLPNTLIYFIIAYVFQLDSGVFCLPYLTTTSSGRWFVPDFRSSLANTASSSCCWIGLNGYFLIEVFFHLYFE